MGKRVIAALMAALILIISGCAAIIEGEYSSSTPHQTGAVSSSQTAEAIVEASNSAELQEALLFFVENYIEYGKIKFTYDGDIDEELSAACIDVSNNTPIGSYAVYYISYNLNKIVSYYEADVSITYKRGQNEVSSIAYPEDSAELEATLLDTMANHRNEYSFYSLNAAFSPETLTGIIEELYYSNPASITYLPKAVISTYPEDNYPCIFEVVFSYPYSRDQTTSRAESITSRVNEILDKTSELTDEEPVLSFAHALNELVDFDYEREALDDYSPWYNTYTAYGALVMQRATGEGFAMALKLLCDASDIECYVVRGRLNNVSHSWNIVRLQSGELYHIDCSMYDGEGDVFYNDSEMAQTHWWDTAAYPACSGESLLEEEEIHTGLDITMPTWPDLGHIIDNNPDIPPDTSVDVPDENTDGGNTSDDEYEFPPTDEPVIPSEDDTPDKNTEESEEQ